MSFGESGGVGGKKFGGCAGGVAGEDLEGDWGRVSSPFFFRSFGLCGILLVFGFEVDEVVGSDEIWAGLPCKLSFFALTMWLWDQSGY
jgi:hypothetical protein